MGGKTFQPGEEFHFKKFKELFKTSIFFSRGAGDQDQSYQAS